MFENQIGVVPVGKNENCKQIFPWLFLPDHTVTPGEKPGRKKDHSMYGLALKYEAFNDINELGMDLVSRASE